MPSRVKQQTVSTKKVFCTHCEEPSEVGRKAMSVFCPHCKKRLILEDFKIKTYHGVREFATCGNVVVEKRGHVAAAVKVGNLTVKGKIHGNVIARGPVRLHKTSVVLGDIDAPTLLVEDGAKLHGFVQIGPTPAANGAE